LSYFLEDDDELQRIHDAYESGEMLTGELKKIAIKEISAYVSKFQERRARISDDELRIFMDGTRPLRLNPRYNWTDKVSILTIDSHIRKVLSLQIHVFLCILMICLMGLLDSFH